MQSGVRGFSGALASAILLFALPLSATQIVINNPGFESPVTFTNNCCTPTQLWASGSVPGWTVTNPGDLVDPAGTWAPEPYFYTTDNGTVLNQLFIYPESGSQVAYSNGGVISQTLTTDATANTAYLTQVSVGLRGELGANIGDAQYTINLYAGDTLLGSWTDDSYGHDHLNPLTGTPLYPLNRGGWQTISFASQNVSLSGVPLTIQLYATGDIQVDFDNVFLSAFPLTMVPEPGTYALIGTALLVLGVLLRRRKKMV
ncbi:MAG TPA: PEP-CTERM sorting domain-containing protein [Bryobacteraceae bacterium]|nr:PEP-CTERM sorting domain-containing protein [Bryobacteraceae bacterium]